jgi:DtxR family Mn-dependent transcriptional regulator
LHLDWSVVHEEAEVLEHAFSDRLIERIDDLLNHPTVDPHGDPIPGDTGQIADQSARTMHQCRTGETLRVTRVLDQGEAFLTFAKKHGLVPGTHIHVTERSDVADTITYQVSGSTFTIGRAPALLVLVEPA